MMENPSKLNFDQINMRANKVKYKQQQSLQYKFIIFIIFSSITSFCQSKFKYLLEQRGNKYLKNKTSQLLIYNTPWPTTEAKAFIIDRN